MRVLLRRLLLLAAFVAAGWYFWYTPATIIAARVLDLEDEYQSKVARRRVRPPESEAVSAGDSFVRNRTNPGSASLYRQRVLASRPLPGSPALPPSWVEDLRAASQGAGPFAAHRNGALVYFRADEAPLDAVAPALRRSLGETGFRNAYTTAGTHDLEFMIFPEPRSSDAPSAVLYPQRHLAGIALLAGLAVYALLGVARAATVRADPLPLVVLDIAAAGGSAFLATLPFRLAASPGAALNDPWGGLIWFGAVALVPCMGLLFLAGREAWRIEVDMDGVRFRGLLRTRFIPYPAIQEASPEALSQPQSAVSLKLATGECLRVPWAGRMGMLSLVDALQHRGLLRDPNGRDNPRFHSM